MESHKIHELTQKLRHLRTLPQSPDILDQINSIYEQLSGLGVDPQSIITNLEHEALLQSRSGADVDLLALLTGQQNLLTEKLNLDNTKLATEQRAIIELLIERRRRQILRDKFQAKLSQQEQLRSHLSSALSGKPETDPNRTNTQDAAALIERKQLTTNTTLSPDQEKQAVAQLSSDLVTLSALTPSLPPLPHTASDFDEETNPQPLSPLGIALITELAFAKVAGPSYSSPAVELETAIDQIVRPATQTDYQTTIIAPEQDQLTYDHTGYVVVQDQSLTEAITQPAIQQTLTTLSTPPEHNPLVADLASSAYRDAPEQDPLITDTIPQHQISNTYATTNILTNQTLSRQLNQATGVKSNQAETLIISEINQQPIGSLQDLSNIGHSIHPSPYAAAAAAVSTSFPQQNALSPELARLLGRGIPSDQIIAAAQSALNKRGAKFSPDQRRLLSQLVSQARSVSKPLETDLLASAKPRLFGARVPRYIERFNSYLNGSRNKFLSAFSGRYARFFQAATNPMGFASSQLGTYAGKRIASHLAGKLSSTALKEGFGIMANQGFKQGINFLSQEAAKKVGAKLLSNAAVHALAQSLNVIPGLGIAVDIALTLAMAAIDKIKNSLHQLAISLYGSKIDAKEAAAGGAAFVGGALVSGVALIGLGAQAALAATFTAAASAFATLFFAAAAAVIIYLSAFNIGPIISTIAQLDSGLGPGGSGTIEDYGSGTISIPNHQALRECGITFPSGYNPTTGYTYQAWTPADQERVENFIALLYGSETFKAVMCKPFKFWRGPTHPTFYGWAPGGYNIVLYSGAFTTDPTLFGMIAHEMGHYYEAAPRTSFVSTGFVFWGARTTITPECSGYDPYSTNCHGNTYPIISALVSEHVCYEENFSEFLRIYVTNDPNSCNGAGTRYQLSPDRYNWIKDNVFGGTVF